MSDLEGKADCRIARPDFRIWSIASLRGDAAIQSVAAKRTWASLLQNRIYEFTAWSRSGEIRGGKFYSITAWSGATDCSRSVALLDPIMIASGIAQAVKIITI
jgi:hypothetical protein